MAKLNYSIAEEIRANTTKTNKELSDIYDVSIRTIQGIKAGEAYKSVNSKPITGPVDIAPLEAVPPGYQVSGISTLVNSKGDSQCQWIKTKAVGEPLEDLIARVMNDLPAKIVPRKASIKKNKPCRDDLMSVYPFGDLHIGMMAWAEETGNNWDLKIAEETILSAMDEMVKRGPRTSKALIVSLGDTIHYDGDKQETTHGGHRLDTDSRPHKVLDTAVRILCGLVGSALEHHDEVEVDIQSGNHDFHTSILLRIAVHAYFHLDPRVKVCMDPATRHYFQFGKCLIGTVHGDKTKNNDLESIMASERSAEWGQTISDARLWLVGHVHHATMKEYRGCKVETFRTLAGKDSWASGRGYLSGRDLFRITFHKEYGEIGRERCSVNSVLGGGSV